MSPAITGGDCRLRVRLSRCVRRRLGDERGSSLVTFLLLAPIFVMFAELIVLGGRIGTTQGDVNSAAREAAREASLASGAASAATVIDPVVETALKDKGFRCQSRTVELGANTDFVAGGTVEVTVTCEVALSDLDLLSIPGTVLVEATAVEPIDLYRVVE
jgi:Flp pilus assembly protein TadG